MPRWLLFKSLISSQLVQVFLFLYSVKLQQNNYLLKFCSTLIWCLFNLQISISSRGGYGTPVGTKIDFFVTTATQRTHHVKSTSIRWRYYVDKWKRKYPRISTSFRHEPRFDVLYSMQFR